MSDLFADRTPPQNIEAEQAVIGAVFLEIDALTTATEVLQPEDFYRAAHQKIFSVMIDLSEKGEPVDLVTVTSELQDLKILEEIGGVSYLSDLANSVPTAANVEYYSKIVEEKSILRRLIRAATDIASDGYAKENEIENLLSEAEKSIMEVSQRKNTGALFQLKMFLLQLTIILKRSKTIRGTLQGYLPGSQSLIV